MRPILESRCVHCHDDQLRSGGFSMASRESIVTPGVSGRTVVPGDAAGSELLRRIKLAADAPGFMPADGSRTPLTTDEIAIIEWWVGAGAAAGTTIGALAVDAASARALTNVLTGRRAEPSAAPVGMTALNPAVVDQIYQSGFLVRPVSRENRALVVGVGGGGASVSAAQWQLLKANGAQLTELDLRRSHVTDADADVLAGLANVTRLHLEGNELTDAGVRKLTGLQHLAYLNLYGNRGITDASVDALAGIASLKRVYLLETGVTPAGLARLGMRRPDLKIDTSAAPAEDRK